MAVQILQETKQQRLARLEAEGLIDPACPECAGAYASPDGIPPFGPRHKPSRFCESGGRPHCTCDRCF